MRILRITGPVWVTLFSLVALAPSARAQTPTGTDPIDLFAKLYPVFSHPRCINCHGVVQSFPGNIRSVTGATHPGDQQGDPTHAAECGSCHDQTPEIEAAWQFTAPAHMWWVGKNLEQLCALQSAEARIFNDAAGSRSPAARGSYLNHLNTDPLVTQAFDGRAGGARDPDPPAPPPMSRAAFLNAAKEWVDAGAGCGRVNGSISQVEAFGAHYTYAMPGRANGKVTVEETAKRQVQILRHSDGTAVGHIDLAGHRTATITYPETGPNGPCAVTIIATTDWVGTDAPPDDTSLEIKIREDFSYEIAFTGPSEKTHATDENRVVQDCGLQVNFDSPPADTDLDWDPWTFTIRCPGTFASDAGNSINCPLNDPQKVPVLAGQMLRTIVGSSDAAEPQSWLNDSPAATARSDDGDPLPITIRTVWHLSLDK